MKIKTTVICVFSVITVMLTACSKKQSDIDFEALTGEPTWQGAKIHPIADANSKENQSLGNKNGGKLSNGFFYWSDREAVMDGLISDIEMPEIKNGKYYFTDGDGYIEITEHKYFQLVGIDEVHLEELRDYYASNGYASIVYQHDQFENVKYTEIEKLKIKEQCDNSKQIYIDLVENKAEFYINPYWGWQQGTNIELTYELTDYGMWFPLLYHYKDENKLVYFDLEWEFVYREDQNDFNK